MCAYAKYLVGGCGLDQGRQNLLVDSMTDMSYVNESYGQKTDGNFPKALSAQAQLAVPKITVCLSSVRQRQPFNFYVID